MINTTANSSRTETSTDEPSKSDIFDNPSAAAATSMPEESKVEEEEVSAPNPAAALAMRKARRKTIVNQEKSVPHITNLNEDP